MADSTDLRAALAVVTREVDELNSQITTDNQALTNARSRISALEGEIATLKARIAELEGGNNEEPPTPPTPPTPTGATLLNTNFDSIPASSPISVTNYKNAMGDSGMTAGTSTVSRTSVVAVAGRGNVLRQTFRAGEYGSGAGIVTFPKLSRAVEEAAIQYDFRFDANFDWSLGGKLPGLGGAVSGTSPGTASGCNDATGNAWSSRAMWITPRSYSSVSGLNEIIGYVYSISKRSECGDNLRTRKAAVAGQWHTLKQYHKLNTPGQANGIHTIWIDGVQVYHVTNYIYRDRADLKITHILWAMFRGGNTAEWAGSRTNYIDIDNLVITTPQ